VTIGLFTLGLAYPSAGCDGAPAAQAEAADRGAYFSLAFSVPNFLSVG
jgi:hypothetical protein